MVILKSSGKICPCPECHNADNQELLLQQSGLTTREIEFAAADQVVRTHYNAAAYDAILSAVARPIPQGMITLWGKPGVGKTMLAQMAVVEAIGRGYKALYITLTGLLESLKAAMDDNGGYGARLREYQSIPVLALDEYTPGGTDWARQIAFDLINHRYRFRNERLTILASNDNPVTFGMRIQSRLHDYGNLVTELKGADMRRLPL